MQKGEKKKGLLARLRPSSLTFTPLCSPQESSKFKTSVEGDDETSSQDNDDPIQSSMLPKIKAAKERAEVEGRNIDSTFLSSTEFAIQDPKSFKKFFQDMGSILG